MRGAPRRGVGRSASSRTSGALAPCSAALRPHLSVAEILMEQLLALDMVRVTEDAAIASARSMGRGDRNGADKLATEAMRRTMDEIDFAGRIVIGEGERDEAPMLYIGEEVGRAWRDPDAPRIDIAVDPLEGTNLVAHGQAGAITVLAASEAGGLTHAPDTYMEKLCVGPVVAGQGGHPRLADGEPRPHRRGARTARRRHHRGHPRAAAPRRAHRRGPRGRGSDQAHRRRRPVGGDHAARSRAPASTRSWAPAARRKGVITAAALRCLGGEIQARFRYRSDDERERGARMGHGDEDRVYMTEDLAPGENLVFAATGVTAGDLLQGVRFFGGGARTHTLTMAYQAKQVRFIDTVHMFDRTSPPRVRL